MKVKDLIKRGILPHLGRGSKVNFVVYNGIYRIRDKKEARKLMREKNVRRIHCTNLGTLRIELA